MDEFVKKLISTTPSANQLTWQKREFYAFFHYGINTFTDREWGDGKEDISQFNPQAMDTDQWCESVAAAGIKGCIFTAKHHDGFCLFSTAQTTHSVMHTPFKKDILAMFAESCKKYGLALGVYLSPWDRHEKAYGTGRPYDDFFCAQLTELLTNYGDIYTVWFDGACGEGENGKKQVYDWQRYYAVINMLQPGAVISICGPDVRWCGNEAGECRPSEWSVVAKRLVGTEGTQQASQQSVEDAERLRTIQSTDMDLGSREILKNEQNFTWYPSEVDTSIRHGWFHHGSEDDKVRSLETMSNIYLKSVGGNAVLLLNIPPHRDGYITEFDRTRLNELGEFVKDITKNPVAAEFSSSTCEDSHPATAARCDDDEYWKPVDDTEACEITADLKGKKKLRYVILKEQIEQSQRIEEFSVVDQDGKLLGSGTTVGYKKILPIDGEAEKITIKITKSRCCPTLKFIGIYE